jgi:hypothetical protein
MIHDPYRLSATELPDSLLESCMAFRRVFSWPCNKALRVGLDAGVRNGWETGHAANHRSLGAVSGSGLALTRSSFNWKLILRLAQVPNGWENLCAVFMIIAISSFTRGSRRLWAAYTTGKAPLLIFTHEAEASGRELIQVQAVMIEASARLAKSLRSRRSHRWLYCASS